MMKNQKQEKLIQINLKSKKNRENRKFNFSG